MSFGIYVHVPFCLRRCGYCAFVTSAPGDDRVPWEDRHRTWARSVVHEIGTAAALLGDHRPPVDTVYLGGGTPTAVDPDLVVAVLDATRRDLDVADDLEVTIECNPDGLRPGQLGRLVDGGVTRVSIGMQSADPAVLRTLDRSHPWELAVAAVDDARSAGAAHVGLDLILGTPGETDESWCRTLDVALACDVDHLSAYALAVEPGTKLAARVRGGSLPAPDPDAAARRYELLDDACTAAGLQWYELSNWAADDSARCRHNLGTWRDHDWWGVGPGAHSHVGSQRWWNHAAEREWATAVGEGRIPAAGHEVLDRAARRCERIMLGIRLREGLAVDEELDPGAVDALVADGLVDRRDGSTPGTRTGPGTDRIVLTRRGRLLADAVVRRLV